MQGVYRSKNFCEKSEARAWSTEVETFLSGRREGTAHLVRDAFERYGREVSVDKTIKIHADSQKLRDASLLTSGDLRRWGTHSNPFYFGE
jgi:hypothetical protein